MPDEPFHVRTIWHPRPADTYQQHKQFLDDEGQVYWCVLYEHDYPHGHLFSENIETLRNQIRSGIDTYLFIHSLASGDDRLDLLGCIEEVETDWTKITNSNLVPSYYETRLAERGQEYYIKFAFLLSKLVEIPKDKPILRYVKLLVGFGQTLYGKDGYPYPCLCHYTGKKNPENWLLDDDSSSLHADSDGNKPDYVFKQVGDIFHLRFEGKETQLRYFKGLKDIQYLLQHPNETIGVLKLVANTDGVPETSSMQAEVQDGLSVSHGMGGNLGKKSDQTAIRQYEQRLMKIDEDIEVAESLGDADKVDRLKREKADLIKNLKDTHPQLSSEIERARVAVTNRISTAKEKLCACHRALYDYLEQTVDTGIRCQYKPNKLLPWSFE